VNDRAALVRGGYLPKPIHFGALVSASGAVSPLCAARPRAIDLRRASWTNRKEAVTCARCRKALKGLR